MRYLTIVNLPVWFHPGHKDPLPPTPNDQPLAAIVTHVHSDSLVNLAVFHVNGSVSGRRDIQLWDGVSDRPKDVGYCERIPVDAVVAPDERQIPVYDGPDYPQAHVYQPADYQPSHIDDPSPLDPGQPAPYQPASAEPVNIGETGLSPTESSVALNPDPHPPTAGKPDGVSAL